MIVVSGDSLLDRRHREFFGAVWRDFLTERIERLVRAEGIAAQALVCPDALTTLSVVGVGADGTPGYHQAVISYDPNVRSGVEPNPQRWRDVLAWMVSRTHVLMLSDADFERLDPGADMHAKAAQWLHAGVRVVAELAVQAAATTCTRRGPDLLRRGCRPGKHGAASPVSRVTSAEQQCMHA